MKKKIFIASEFKCILYEKEYYLAPKIYTIYKRYSDFFGGIVLCSRIERKTNLPEGYKKASFIVKVIEERSLLAALLHFYDKKMCKEIEQCDLIIGRLPSIIGYRAFGCAKKLNKKFLAECMGEAWESYWNHSFFGKLIAGYMELQMRNIIKKAHYVLYVTEKFLQNKYPNQNKTIGVSNVVLKNVSEETLKKRLEKIKSFDSKRFSIATVAGVNVKAKGHKFVIKAIAKLRKKGFKIDYYLVGGGNQKYLKNIAKRYKIIEQVHFLGELSLNQVLVALDRIDLYIQPSLQEGLPRAVIEAMSRGCPCLGANTAGIPELLNKECIFKRKSAKAIIQAIIQVTQKDLSIYAVKNFEKSKFYLENELNKKRNEYFNSIYNDLIGKNI